MAWRKRAQEQVTHITLFHIKVTDKGKQGRQHIYTHRTLRGVCAIFVAVE
jgi:hypothetical protein